MADYHYTATLFRDYYLARAEQYGLLESGTAFFTDKMPFNEIYLPLIKMAFPNAKIVRVVRHPLDVCVSMLSNNMTHGFHCGYRIEDISNHLAAVHELVEHYGKELELNELVLRYETLVADQEGQTRKLLDYLGLPFEPACLRVSREPPLRADAELCAGDRETQRPVHRSIPDTTRNNSSRTCHACAR